MYQDNIVKFVGAVLESPKLMLLHEYCPKGSLQVNRLRGIVPQGQVISAMCVKWPVLNQLIPHSESFTRIPCMF